MCPAPGERSGWCHAIGRAAEDLAATFLERRGCIVVDRRYRARGGEIDLIVRDGAWTAFVEVKARRRGSAGRGAEAVGRRKQRRIGSAAAAWLTDRGPGAAYGFRFDVVEVTFGGGTASVSWIRDAFRL